MRGNPWLALITICLGFFMAMLDATIVSIAVPTVLRDLDASLDAVLWVFNAYILVIAVLLITGGRVGDLLGRRRVFVAGLAVFTFASLLCGLAQTPGQLIAARVLQGVGAALLTPQTIALVLTVFPFERLGVAFGIYGAVAGVAAIAGPTLGGLLVDWFGWRWIFFVNLPVSAVTVALAYLTLPDVRHGARPRFDIRGVVLASAGLLAVTFGLIEGERYRWSSVILILIAGGIVLLGAFVWTQRRPDGLVPLLLFRHRNFSLMNVMTGAVQFALLGVYLPLAIYLQSVLGLSALEAGAALIAMPLVSTVVAPFAGHLADRGGSRWTLVAGTALFAAGIVMLAAVAGPESNGWVLQPALIVAGVGTGLIFAPMTTVAMRDLPLEVAGAASGVLNTTRQFGNILGTVAVGALLQNRLTHSLGAEASARAAQVPQEYRRPFIDAFDDIAGQGVSVGVGQTGADLRLPPGLTPDVVTQIRGAAEQVFTHGFADALKPTLALPAIVLISALACAATVREPSKASSRGSVRRGSPAKPSP